MTDITKLLDEHPLPWCAKPWAIDGVALYDANDDPIDLNLNTWDDANFVLALANALHAERQKNADGGLLAKALEEAAELRASIHSLPDPYDDDGDPTWGTGRIEAVKRQLEEMTAELHAERQKNAEEVSEHRATLRHHAEERDRRDPPINDSGDVDALRRLIGQIDDIVASHVSRLHDIERRLDAIGKVEKRLDAIASAARGSDD